MTRTALPSCRTAPNRWSSSPEGGPLPERAARRRTAPGRWPLALLLALALLGAMGAACRGQDAQADEYKANAPQWSAPMPFPKLWFEQPVDLQHAPDGTDRLFVVEQPGVIKVFEPRPDVTEARVVLDIKDRVDFGGEKGLLGLAFHPKFKENGYFYVNYTTPGPLRTIISRFVMKGDEATPDTETVLLEIPQPYGNHNGGQVAFGPDGMLYIAVGDGGAANDPHDHGQNRATLLGAILRIDVDRPDPNRRYGIPKDNPFAGNKEGWRAEIWAWGLRNPWRMSFDPDTGELWTGDVGQNKIEEITIVKKGGNHGWRPREGRDCFEEVRCRGEGFVDPVAQYTHQHGNSVTGGLVYRGKALTALKGAYVYADFGSGRIWALRRKGDKAEVTQLLKAPLNITSFGQDRHGNLYMLHIGGSVHTLAPPSP